MKYRCFVVRICVISLVAILTQISMAQTDFHVEFSVKRGESANLQDYAFSQDGRYAAAYSRSTGILIWDLERGSLSHGIQYTADEIGNLTLTPTGESVILHELTRQGESRLVFLDRASGEVQKTFDCSLSQIKDIIFIDEGAKLVLSGARRNNNNALLNGLIVIDVQSGEELHRMEAAGWNTNRGFSHAAMHPDEKHMLISGFDRELKWVEFEQAAIINNLSEHLRSIEDITITPNGRFALVADYSGAVRIWDLNSMLNIRTLMNGKREGRDDIAAVGHVVVTPDGKQVITASNDHYLRIWDFETGQLEKKIFCGNWTNMLYVTPDGRRLYARVLPYIIGYDIKSWEEIFRFNYLKDGHWAFITAQGFYNGTDGVHKYMKAVVNGKKQGMKKYAFTYHQPEKVAEILGKIETIQTELVDAASVKQSDKPETPADRYAQYNRCLPVEFEPVIQQGHVADCSLWFDPTGKLLISSTGYNGEIKIWSMKTGALLKTFDKQSFKKNSVGVVAGISHDGKILVTNMMKEIYIWDLETFQLIQSFKVTDDQFCSVAFHPNGKELITSTKESAEPIRVWDFRSGKVLRLFSGEYGKFKYGVDEMVIGDNGLYMCGKYADTELLWNYQSGNLYSGNDEEKAQIIQKIRHGHPSTVVTRDFKNNRLLVGQQTIDVDALPFLELARALKDDIYRIKFEPTQGLLGLADKNRILLADVATGKVLRIFEGESPAATPFSILPQNKGILLTGRNGRLDLLPFDSFHFQDHPAGYPERIGDFLFDPSGRYLVSRQSPVKVWDMHQARWVAEVQPEMFGVGANALKSTHYLRGFDAKNNAFITCFKDLSSSDEYQRFPRMAKWTLSNGRRLKTTGQYKKYHIRGPWNSDAAGKYFVTGMFEDLEIWNAGSMRPKHVVDLPWQFSKYYEMSSFFFDARGRYLAAGGRDAIIRVWTMQGQGSVFKGKNPTPRFTLSGHWWGIYAMAFHPAEPVLASGDAFGNIILWDLTSGLEVKRLLGHSGVISQMAYSDDGRLLFSRGGDDGVLNIWRTDNDERISLMVSGSEWIIYTPDGFFDASRNGGNLIRLRKGLDAFGVDQFALRNNRPDIIMKRLGIGSDEAIEHYYAMYQKRLRRSGITEEQLQVEFKAPEVELLASEQVEKSLHLRFNVKDESYRIQRYNIYVNDVPLFGGYGKLMPEDVFQIEESIELNAGENKVEVTCTNEIGVESFRALTLADYDGDVQPDLYYLGFGISQYANPALNLNYAHKDALDLAAALTQLRGQFGQVHVKTLTDEGVTIENIKAAKSFLDNARVDDVFVLFIAGHGMYSSGEDATYYYLTYNTDLANLAGTAANFELIEDLLQGISPRKKLFLMDTCESGEIEEETQNSYFALADARGIKARTVRGITIRKRSERPKRSYLYQKDRYIYNDLQRRSGAIVFSSSRGGEFSYESDEVENGFFTEEILKCLTQGVGDKDGNGIITSDELRVQVAKAVAEATNNAQHPTVDRDNIYQKIGFPVVK
ncbi:caspase family protein [bacterium]|nr:caspase family protein [bacterium]